ncbi:AAA family ATPase [Micromonospora arida]
MVSVTAPGQEVHPSDTATRVSAAASLLAEVLKATYDSSPLPLRVRRQFRVASLAELELVRRGRRNREERCAIALREAVLLAEAAMEDGSRGTLRDARKAAVVAAVELSELHHPDPRAYGHYAALARHLVKQLKTWPSLRQRLARLERGSVEPKLSPDLGAREDELVRLSGLVARADAIQAYERLADLPGPPADLPLTSTAELITRVAAAESTEALAGRAPAADLSERDLRLLGIEFTGFRGSPGRSAIGFTDRGGHPVTCVIVGDNGVGKSTIADAIEFALQGRVGRSSDLASQARPLATNQAVEATPQATAVLSDGTSVTRTVVTSADGRARADSPDVRPGFRLAPITLKRADILAFLDSGSMSRGTVLFDYFPTDSSGMARSLEDERVSLGDRMHDQRTRRDSLIEQLAGHLSVEPDLLRGTEAFHRYVSVEIVGEGTEDERRDAWEKLDARTVDLIQQLRTTYRQLAQLKRQLEKDLNLLNPVAYPAQAQQLRTILRGVGTELTKSFLAVTRARHVDRIEVQFGRSGPVSIDIVVAFTNGRFCYPKQVFSEGYCDLLALLFFLAVAKEAASRGQAKVLVLDDVLQSVDSGIRLGALGHLLQEFKDWQLVLTVHDRLWLEQLRVLLAQHGRPFIEHHIQSWTFETGPQLAAGGSQPAALVRGVLATGDATTICAVAGRQLERLCQEISMRLNVKVTRRLDDKYTLGDLWGPCAKELKKTSVRAVVESLELRQHLRNMVGAHQNQWAASLPLSDAVTFAEDVAALLDAMYCTTCEGWVTRNHQLTVCRCGMVALRLA